MSKFDNYQVLIYANNEQAQKERISMPKNRKIKKLDVTLAFWVALVATIIVLFLALAFSSSF